MAAAAYKSRKPGGAEEASFSNDVSARNNGVVNCGGTNIDTDDDDATKGKQPAALFNKNEQTSRGLEEEEVEVVFFFFALFFLCLTEGRSS